LKPNVVDIISYFEFYYIKFKVKDIGIRLFDFVAKIQFLCFFNKSLDGFEFLTVSEKVLKDVSVKNGTRKY